MKVLLLESIEVENKLVNNCKKEFEISSANLNSSIKDLFKTLPSKARITLSSILQS